jgi:hypothetical protein
VLEAVVEDTAEPSVAFHTHWLLPLPPQREVDGNPVSAKITVNAFSYVILTVHVVPLTDEQPVPDAGKLPDAGSVMLPLVGTGTYVTPLTVMV